LIVFDLTQGYHPVLMDCALSGLGAICVLAFRSMCHSYRV